MENSILYLLRFLCHAQCLYFLIIMLSIPLLEHRWYPYFLISIGHSLDLFPLYNMSSFLDWISKYSYCLIFSSLTMACIILLIIFWSFRMHKHLPFSILGKFWAAMSSNICYYFPVSLLSPSGTPITDM